MRLRPLPILLSAALAAGAASPARAAGAETSVRFEVSLPPGLASSPQDGRLLVLLGKRGDPEPRKEVGLPGTDDPLILGRDVRGLAPGRPAEVDGRAVAYPLASLADLPPGDYFAQAVLEVNRDLRGILSPGNFSSVPIRVHLDPARRSRIGLELSRREPDDAPPPDGEFVRYVRIQSRLLSEFHHRPIFLRAGVILPRDYGKDPRRRYPLWIHIGGYGARYTEVAQWMEPGSEFRRAWEAEDAPSLIVLHLDGAGPFGDPYQIDSANNGPYGEAITRELIPYVEEKFRGPGTPEARFLEGGSTGGWVSLALQILYPDTFNGAWSSCPDGVDFRAFQLLNIYEDDNAYVNAYGNERPSARDADGDVLFTMRREVREENVLGNSDSWTLSGGQWGAWNAAYGPKGADGLPAPLWDPRTGRIDHRIAEAWKRYDLRLVLEQRWPELGPKLRGKIHIWVGEADTFFLNNAVHMLEEFLATASPPFEGTIVFGPRKEHCWSPLSRRELMEKMAAAASSRPAMTGPAR